MIIIPKNTNKSKSDEIGFHSSVYKFQVKGRKAIADYLKPCAEVYGQILKEDRKEALVTIRYQDLLNLFKIAAR